MSLQSGAVPEPMANLGDIAKTLIEPTCAIQSLTGRVQRVSGGTRHRLPEAESLAGTTDQVRPQDRW